MGETYKAGTLKGGIPGFVLPADVIPVPEIWANERRRNDSFRKGFPGL